MDGAPYPEARHAHDAAGYANVFHGLFSIYFTSVAFPDRRMSAESDADYLRNSLLDFVSRKYGPDYGQTALELERRALDAGNGPEEAFHRRVIGVNIPKS